MVFVCIWMLYLQFILLFVKSYLVLVINRTTVNLQINDRVKTNDTVSDKVYKKHEQTYDGLGNGNILKWNIKTLWYVVYTKMGGNNLVYGPTDRPTDRLTDRQHKHKYVPLFHKKWSRLLGNISECFITKRNISFVHGVCTKQVSLKLPKNKLRNFILGGYIVSTGIMSLWGIALK